MFVSVNEFHYFTYLNLRAINAQALVGNIGGYLGLFMGYSILQLPIIIHALTRKLKTWYSKLKSRDDPVANKLFLIRVRESPSSISHETENETENENFEPRVMLALEKLGERLSKIEEEIRTKKQCVCEIQKSLN